MDSPNIIGRLVGVDYGPRRIGLAITDVEQRLASPADVLYGVGAVAGDARRVAAWGVENEAAGYVVGLPLNMDGTVGAQAQLSQRFVAELRRCGTIPVVVWDERLSSFQADELLDEANVRGDRRRRKRDALAAMVILRSYLDARPER